MAKKKKAKSKAKGKTGASRITARKAKTGRVARSSGKDVASADRLIRIIFMYVTSRMPNSGKFVIAK